MICLLSGSAPLVRGSRALRRGRGPGAVRRDVSSGPRRSDTDLKLGEAARVARSRAGTGTAVPGAPSAPARLRPQSSLAVAAPRVPARVSCAFPGPDRPPQPKPRSPVLPPGTVRRWRATCGVTGVGEGHRPRHRPRDDAEGGGAVEPTGPGNLGSVLPLRGQ